MLKYVLINNHNINKATKIQMKIFPQECAYKHYQDAIKSNLDYEKYYLVYKDNVIIGITGLYSKEDIY